MNYGRLYSDYKDEIELAWIQNSAVECELYSIIANIIRESENGRKISLRDVSARRTTENSKTLKGNSGFPDFVVLERVKKKDATTYGCIEIKRPNITLDITTQIKGHISSFKRVIYTNGLLWKFFNGSETILWECELGKIHNGFIEWKPIQNWFVLLEKLDSILWVQQ